MLGVLPVIIVLFGSCYAEWKYTKTAFTKDGRPCLTDCLGQSCIVDWSGNLMECTITDSIAAKFRTAQLRDKNHSYCLSNCGFFGYEYEWCVTSEKNDWDYCNSSDYHVSSYKHSCKEPCDKRGENYYWCFVEGGSWQYCAPPREKQY